MSKFLSCDKGVGAVEYVIGVAAAGFALSIAFPNVFPGVAGLVAKAIAAWP